MMLHELVRWMPFNRRLWTPPSSVSIYFLFIGYSSIASGFDSAQAPEIEAVAHRAPTLGEGHGQSGACAPQHPFPLSRHRRPIAVVYSASSVKHRLRAIMRIRGRRAPAIEIWKTNFARSTATVVVSMSGLPRADHFGGTHDAGSMGTSPLISVRRLPREVRSWPGAADSSIPMK